MRGEVVVVLVPLHTVAETPATRIGKLYVRNNYEYYCRYDKELNLYSMIFCRTLLVLENKIDLIMW
jgi:hypothetical protein